MRKLLLFILVISAFIIAGCETTTTTTTTTTTSTTAISTTAKTQLSTTLTTATTAMPISDPSATKDSFSKEPMDTKYVNIDNVNVVYEYGQPVPSFDDWNTKEPTRNFMTLDGNWQFTTDPNNVGVQEEWYAPSYDTSAWQTRPVPSSWDMYDYSASNKWGQGYPFYDGYAWYSRTFTLDDSWNGQYIKANFLAVNYRTWVYVNGVLAGAHESGNTSFSMDITPYLKTGTNTITLRVYRRPDYSDYTASTLQAVTDNKAIPAGPVDYWPYAGITKDCWLEGSNPVTVSKILTNAVSGNLQIEAVVYNTSVAAQTVEVNFDPGSATGGTDVTQSITVQPQSARVVKELIAIPDAKEWSYVEPNLYTAYVTLYSADNSTLLDGLHVTYGMRQISISGTKLLLNGQQIFLKGVDWHEETSTGGRTLTEADYNLLLGLVKQMGMNFVRNSHYNRHQYAYEYADAHGIMMLDEAENMWLSADAINEQYTTYGLSRAAVMMMVWNDMDHPAVIMWSMCNEVNYGGDYISWIRDLYSVAKAVDIQDRPVTWAAVNTSDPASQYADVIGFNEYAGFFWGQNSDLTNLIVTLHNQYPNKPLLITENGSWSTYGDVGDASTGGTEDWQAAGYQSHFDQTVALDSYMVGYTYWLLKDYKTREGYNQDSIGISTMGIVPFNYSQAFIDNAQSIGMSPYKLPVYNTIVSEKNPFTYIPKD